jgi:CPA2 family monovalent cation:H+ antiporter-2
VIIISIALAPILIRKSEVIATVIFGRNNQRKHFADIEAVVSAQPRREHVIICGYGRMGHSLALFLEQENIPYVGIELDPERLEEALIAEEPIYYGDATKEETLLGAGLLQARLVIITFHDAHRTRKMLKFIRFHQPSIPVLVRARDDKYLTSLQQCGATEVISESLESSLMMASHMLLCLGLDAENIHKKIAHIKSYRYHMMRTFYQQDRLETNTQKQIFSRTIFIDEESFACGKTLAQLVEPAFPATIQSFTRSGIRSNSPHLEMVFEPGDILTVEGTEDQIFAAQERLEQGV